MQKAAIFYEDKPTPDVIIHFLSAVSFILEIQKKKLTSNNTEAKQHTRISHSHSKRSF